MSIKKGEELGSGSLSSARAADCDGNPGRYRYTKPPYPQRRCGPDRHPIIPR